MVGNEFGVLSGFTAIEILNLGSPFPAKILNDGDVCLVRFTAVAAQTLDVELFINGVLTASNTITVGGSGTFHNFLCPNYPRIGWGGTLRNTDEVEFEIDNLRWEMQGTP